MAHKALVAYERPDSDYNLHYSHEGALNLQLAIQITSETPFGGVIPSTDQRTRLELMLQCEPGGADISVEEDRYPSRLVEMEPREIALSLVDIYTEYLDYLLHEALYVVDRTYDVTAYRTFAFSIEPNSNADDAATVGNGVLIPVQWDGAQPISDGVLRGRLRALRDVASDMVDRDAFDEDSARAYMIQKLQEWVPDDADIQVHRPR